MGLILTTPAGFGTTATVTLQDVSVPANTTKIVDNASIIHTPAVKWRVTIKNTTTNESISQEISANVSNSIPKHSRYGIVGTLLPHAINVALDVTETLLQLEITNTTVDNYAVDITR